MNNVIYKDNVYTYNGFTWHPCITNVTTKDRKNYKVVSTMHDKNLICFMNGVYELDTMIFRPNTPNDYCRYNTHYNFNNTYDDHFWDCLQSVFVNWNEYQLFMRYMYALFIGHQITINCDNGYLFRFIDRVYGSYGINVDGTALFIRRLYSVGTNLDYYQNNFNGKYIYMCDYPNTNLPPFTSYLLVNEEPIDCMHNFKVKEYPFDNRGILPFMTKMMDLHEAYKKYMLLEEFIINDIFMVIMNFFIDVQL